MEGLQEAVAGKQVEIICAAYQALRSLARANGIDPLKLAEEVLGPGAANLLVSAFSHLHCFMCQGGSVPCDQCEGEGHVAAGKPCPQCEGFGLAECSFCSGTNWADRAVIPDEIKRYVHHRQLAHVRDDLHQVVKTFMGLTAASVEAMDLPKRREMARHLLRLQARVRDLLALQVTTEPKETQHLASLADKLTRCREAIKPKK